MAQNTMKKIEEAIRRDGSLSEERKTELLNLLATMKPELRNYTNLKKNARREYIPVQYPDRMKM